MKPITFTKQLKILSQCLKPWRPDYPGYLLTHSDHPGREFVIARGSKITDYYSGDWVHTKRWFFHDLKTGLSLDRQECMVTRRDRTEAAIVYLSRTSPEKLEAIVNNTLAERLGKLMNL
jgi:hypothetical protein